MTASIAVLGSANMDLVVRQPRPVRPGETIFGSGFDTGAGGKGLNQAVAAARAGAQVAFVGAVGDDAFGTRLREVLTEEGVDAARLVTAGDATGIAAITVTDDGENAIVVVPGANARAELTAGDRDAIGQASYLVVQLERPVPLVAEALRYARERGVVTVVTPAPVVDGAGELIAWADILVPNQHEAIQLSGAADARSAAIALSGRAGTVIVTLGGDGALVARGGEIVSSVRARPVDTVDTTGAGDTFVGVLVAWLAAGHDLDTALSAATAAASIAVTRPGAAASMPSRAEILTQLQGAP